MNVLYKYNHMAYFIEFIKKMKKIFHDKKFYLYVYVSHLNEVINITLYSKDLLENLEK